MNRKPFFLVSINYFAFFLCIGAFSPFITLYLQNAGWSGFQIGIYSAVGPLVTFLTQPLWGLISDAWGNIRLLYALLMLGTGIITIVFGLLPVTAVFLLLPLLLGITQGPLNPMLDSIAIQMLGENRNNLGRTRLWGSISFASISFVMGSLFAKNNSAIFYGYALAAIFATLMIYQVPASSLDVGDQGKEVDFRWSSIRQALSHRFTTFLGAVFLLQLAHHMALSFLSVVMADRGATSTLVGYAWSFTAVVEIPVFFLSTRLLENYEPEKLLAAAGFITTVRLGLFSITHEPWLMVFTHAIDGLAFPLIMVSLVLVVDKLVPAELRTTGLTVQAAVSITLPRLLGSLLGGRIYDKLGGSMVFYVSTILALIGSTAIVFWHSWDVKTTPKQQTPELKS